MQPQWMVRRLKRCRDAVAELEWGFEEKGSVDVGLLGILGIYHSAAIYLTTLISGTTVAVLGTF